MADKSKSSSFALIDQLITRLKAGAHPGIMLAVIGVIAAIIYLIYTIIFLGQVYPNTYLGDQKFSGLTQEDLRQKLQTISDTAQATPIHLTYGGKSYSVSAKEANWSLNLTEAVDRLYSRGRVGNYFQQFAERLIAPVVSRHFDAPVSYDRNYLETTVAAIAEEVDQPAKDATADFQAGKLTVSREKTGERINRTEIVDTLLTRWITGSVEPIALVRLEERPTVVITDEAALGERVNQLAEVKLTLKWPEGSKSLKKADIYRLIGFVRGEPIAGKEQTYALTAEFTTNKIKAYLEEIASEGINKPAREPRLALKDSTLVIVEASQSGEVVDLEKSAEAVLAALKSQSGSEVQLTFKSQAPSVNEKSLGSLGVKEMIGRGETSFAGSPNNRKVNIGNGVRLLQGFLVKPNEEFSTVKTLGAVDGTTGFLPELVIKDNRTTPEYGGGLCQVSTTLFRAVLNAGLKVTERQNHSYRVSYYEPPVGLDATIYLPRPDFKFLNDTGQHILVLGRVEGNKVIFELWGTKDGRTATVTDPQILSTTPVGEPIYAETDTLPKGEVKQIEKPHDGAVTVAYYTVIRNGQVINKQTFKSVYKAWPARYLVGTKEVTPEAPVAQ